MTTLISNTPSRKRKRVSKNKKKNWRKTDITDVEEYLDDVRLQERTGGLVSEKADEQLFFVDTSTKESVTDDTVLPKRAKREKKPLKCHAILEPDSRIKPLRVKTSFRKDLPKKLCAAKRNKDQLSKKEQTSLQQRQEALEASKQKKIKNAIEVKNAEFDLWGDEDINAKPADLEDYFAVKTKKVRVARPVTAKQKRSELSAIENPHPGQSYNPTFEDHQTLLRDALAVEIVKAKKEAKIKRALDDAFPEKSQAPTAATYIAEMSAGLFEGDESDVEVTQEDLEAISVNPPVRRENKKTEKQRKKQEKLKQQAKERSKEKSEKLLKKELNRIKSLTSEVKKDESKWAAKQAQKAAQREANKNRTRKLGKLKFEEGNIPIKLSDELEGSLRLLKPEGHLLEDRYKSLQKRNILEPRQKEKVVRKYKPKKFEKKSHKAVTL